MTWPLVRSSALLAASTLGVLAGCTASPEAPAPAAVRARVVDELGPLLRAAHGALAPGEATAPGAGVEAVLATLTGEVFTDARHRGDGLYDLPVELACAPLDAPCLAAFAAVAPRIRVGIDGEALTLALELGAAPVVPLRVDLTAEVLTAAIDLDDLGPALGVLAPLVGAPAPALALAGALSVSLRTAPLSATTTADVIEVALDVAIERPLRVVRGGADGLVLDLVPDRGPVHLAVIGELRTGTRTVSASPLLDVRIHIDHAVLGDAPPAFDVTQVVLSEGVRTRRGADQIEIVGGMLAVQTEPAAYGFAAVDRQCVHPAEAGGWTVATCR